MKRMIQFCSAAAVIALAVMAAGCSSSDGGAADSAGGSSSKGGSMARFTIVGDWLYTVNESRLTVVSLSDPSRPVKGESHWIGSNIETIFAADTLLFIGSQNGMYIYNIKKPEFPKEISRTFHFRSCDPVVAADTLAFVTLNSALGSWCGQTANVLQVYNIKELRYPQLLMEVPMSSPRGLAVDIEQKLLFVCDNGIRAYDISDPRNVEVMYTNITVSEVGRIDAYDCILLNGKLLVIGADGLYQFGYDREGFSFISKIDIRSEQ